MTLPAVVLVVQTGLDVQAARRLGDYGDLDDASVARALEQVHVQRWGHFKPPGYLTRIEALAAVIDDGDGSRLIRPAPALESVRLDDLAASWPWHDSALVDWDGTTQALLAARALTHDLVMPQTLETSTGYALARCVGCAAADQSMPSEQVELECLRLMGGLESDDEPPDIVSRVLARYQLWLRWQHCTGRIDDDTWFAHVASLSDMPLEEDL